MKILQVTNFFKPSWEGGGPTRAAYQISKKLTEHGHKVTVYTTDGYKSRLKVKKNKPKDVDGILTYYFRNLSIYISSKFVFPIPYTAFLTIRKNIMSFDIIHIHEYRTFLAILIHYYAKKNDIPYVVQARGSVLPFFKRQKLKTIFDMFFSNILLDASKLIALNEREVEEYIMMGVDKNKIEIMSNGIDMVEYAKLPTFGQFRKKYQINNYDNIILFLGRIHKIKGVDLLIDAFSDLVNRLENTKLIIAGPDDGLLTDIQNQVKFLSVEDKVIFTGPLYDQDKLEAYVDADVYVLPSVSECFPNTILEACACKKAVVVTEGCGIKNVIHNNIGFVANFDKLDLSDKMFSLLTDATTRKKFEQNAYNLVLEKYNWDKIGKDMERLYAETLKIN
ncbi:MAG: hypothetical protein A9957_09430 [Methanohalophilus sp. DAL1]|nr:MAG: hypothetical protein A9957_09430 [Methanohalophilus sp. DAL1]